jgi:NH3-dependent NAD+ synthetase
MQQVKARIFLDVGRIHEEKTMEEELDKEWSRRVSLLLACRQTELRAVGVVVVVTEGRRIVTTARLITLAIPNQVKKKKKKRLRELLAAARLTSL